MPAKAQQPGPLINALGQPVGPPLAGWRTPPAPPRTVLIGRFCRLEPLDAARHARDLFAANNLDPTGRNWTYLFDGPFEKFEDYERWAARSALGQDPLFYAIAGLGDGMPAGVASYLRIDRAHGVIEVGHINYSPRLQRTPAGTEAMFLMMRRAFDELGYRRYEWKCDALNARSRAAALRLGFQYEGLFRQAITYKGRSRDTAWYSIIDGEWPALRAAYEGWLAPSNFDAGGRQLRSLDHCIAAGRGSSLPVF